MKTTIRTFQMTALMFVIGFGNSGWTQTAVSTGYSNQVIDGSSAPAVVPGAGAPTVMPAGDPNALLPPPQGQQPPPAPPKKDKKSSSDAAAKMMEMFQALASGLGQGGGANQDDMHDNPQGSISADGFSGMAEDPGAINANRDVKPLDVDMNCNRKSGLQVADDEDAIAEYAKNLRGHICSPRDTDRLTCMVCNIYFEARTEPPAGQVAAGQTVMTRLFSPNYSTDRDTVCKTVWKNKQYSWTMPSVMHPSKRRMVSNLTQVVRSATKALCKGASDYTNYYAWKLVNPKWARNGSECRNTARTLGLHTFCTINKGSDQRSLTRVLASEGLGSSRLPASDNGGSTAVQED